jgi:hypothetical protein
LGLRRGFCLRVSVPRLGLEALHLCAQLGHNLTQPRDRTRLLGDDTIARFDVLLDHGILMHELPDLGREPRQVGHDVVV